MFNIYNIGWGRHCIFWCKTVRGVVEIEIEMSWKVTTFVVFFFSVFFSQQLLSTIVAGVLTAD